MSREATRNLLLCIVVIALAWSLLYALRPGYIVEGSIGGTLYRHYPWQIGPRFDLRVVNAAGRLIDFRDLRGNCDGAAGQFSPCSKPELPAGAPIKLIVYAFSNPNECRDPPGFRRISVPCFRPLDHVGSIEVDGHPVTAGWATPAAIYLLYALIAAAVAVLAFNDWHAMRIRVRTVAVFAFVAGTCVFFGYAYY